MKYPISHKVPAAPEGKTWVRIRKGFIKKGDWLGDMRSYANGAVGTTVEGLNWIVYRLRNIPVKITPLPSTVTTPKGFVYLGMKDEFKRPDYTGFMGDCANPSMGVKPYDDGREVHVNGNASGHFYFAKIGSPIALLNGHKAPAKTPLELAREENETLKKEISNLRAKLETARAAVKTLSAL